MRRIEAIERRIENHLWHFGLDDCDKQLIHSLYMDMVDFAREAHQRGYNAGRRQIPPYFWEDFEQWVAETKL